MFIRGSSQMSYQQMLVRRVLSGEPARRFMKSDPVTVPPSTPLSELVEEYFYEYHYKMFPVVDNGTLLGCVTTRDIKDVPRQQWQQQTAEHIVHRCSDDNTISPEMDAVKALSRM